MGFLVEQRSNLWAERTVCGEHQCDAASGSPESERRKKGLRADNSRTVAEH